MHRLHRQIPLATLTLCALSSALPACERPATGPSVDPASATGSRSDTASAAQAEAPPGSTAGCRALVNAPGELDEMYDLRLFGDGRDAEIDRAPGRVMVIDERVLTVQAKSVGRSLQRATIEVRELPAHPDAWNFTFDTYGGAEADAGYTLDACITALDDPDGADVTTGCYEGHYVNDGIAVTNIVGPFISLSAESYGETGGAHAVDSVQLETWNLSGGKAQAMAPDEVLDADQVQALASYLETYAVDAFGDEDDEAYDYDIGLDMVSTVAFTTDEEGTMSVEATVGCCAWNVNHGHFEIAIPLDRAPRALAAYLPSPERKRWEREGCGSIDDQGIVRDANNREVGDLGGRPMSVYWLDAKHPFFVDMVAEFPVHDHAAPELEGELAELSPGDAGRRMMKSRDFEAAAGLFDLAVKVDAAGPWLGELGWAEFHLGHHDQARALLNEALRKARSKRQLAAIAYNLGRVEEAAGDLDAAEIMYEKSLALRRSGIVERRLKALREPKGKATDR